MPDDSRWWGGVDVEVSIWSEDKSVMRHFFFNIYQSISNTQYSCKFHNRKDESILTRSLNLLIKTIFVRYFLKKAQVKWCLGVINWIFGKKKCQLLNAIISRKRTRTSQLRYHCKTWDLITVFVANMFNSKFFEEQQFSGKLKSSVSPLPPWKLSRKNSNGEIARPVESKLKLLSRLQNASVSDVFLMEYLFTFKH